ncbi:M16 family metallopeptidase [Thalassotalea castellviae]|uniref:Pitrilysin family protein n=1 Tax=Thalassotalea castellviae TaxID=3075612 RepID=A0ABU3A2K7_9GAMM|nr:pitrilysin family protein [Thalassotalea sp. W431]MDT0604407.1 pitrilysin family protein [Thalassotalea sp. W431]
MMRIFNYLFLLSITVFSAVSLAKYTLPTYEKLKLNNGLVIYLMEQKEVPLIDISVVVKVGAIEDGKRAGLNYFTARNLTLGTQSLNKSELDETIDFVGADIFSSANLEFVTLGASLASKDQQKILPIVRDLVTAPRFDKSEFDKIKQRHILNLQQSKERPGAVINHYFNQLVFGEQGYGSVVQGDSQSIEKLTLEQLKQHYQQWYQPSNSAVIVVGDFDRQQMKKQLKSLFASWKNTQQVTATQIAKVAKASQSKVLLVNKPDARQSTFLIGGKGIAQSNPDRVGISVINTILGARFTSWLNDELRVNAGLTYGARSRFNSYSQDGSFAISTFTKTDTTVEAIDLALQTYARLWEKGIDNDTLNSAKAYVKGQFPPQFETSSELASLLVNMYGYQFDESFINTFEQQVDSLTTEKSKQLIQQYFPQENLQFVVIGQADAIRDKLTKYGEIVEVNINDIGFNTK